MQARMRRLGNVLRRALTSYARATLRNFSAAAFLSSSRSTLSGWYSCTSWPACGTVRGLVEAG